MNLPFTLSNTSATVLQRALVAVDVLMRREAALQQTKFESFETAVSELFIEGYGTDIDYRKYYEVRGSGFFFARHVSHSDSRLQGITRIYVLNALLKKSQLCKPSSCAVRVRQSAIATFGTVLGIIGGVKTGLDILIGVMFAYVVSKHYEKKIREEEEAAAEGEKYVVLTHACAFS